MFTSGLKLLVRGPLLTHNALTFKSIIIMFSHKVFFFFKDLKIFDHLFFSSFKYDFLLLLLNIKHVAPPNEMMGAAVRSFVSESPLTLLPPPPSLQLPPRTKTNCELRATRLLFERRPSVISVCGKVPSK